MDASSPPPDATRELNELRARAYGPHPDIQDDPAALARLAELEAAHMVSPPDGDLPESGAPAAAGDEAPLGNSTVTAAGADRPDSAAGIAPVMASSAGSSRLPWQRLTATRAGRSTLIAGALVAILALVYSVDWLVGPHPDARLHPIADEADRVVLSLIDFLGVDADPSTIRGYGPYQEAEAWFLVDTHGFHCFMIIQRPIRAVDGANCVPPGVDLFADIGSPLYGEDETERLPDGSIIRFHYRGDSVDVFVYPAAQEN